MVRDIHKIAIVFTLNQCSDLGHFLKNRSGFSNISKYDYNCQKNCFHVFSNQHESRFTFFKVTGSNTAINLGALYTDSKM